MHEYLRYAMVTIQSDSHCRQGNRYPGYNNDRMICGEKNEHILRSKAQPTIVHK